MRHKFKFRILGRTRKHRKALFRNLTTSLVEHERIETTLEKAKEVRRHVERLIHKSKPRTFNAYKDVRSYLYTKETTRKAFYELGPRYNDLPGGYTRIKPLGRRKGDNARKAYIELVGNPISVFEENERAERLANVEHGSFWEWE